MDTLDSIQNKIAYKSTNSFSDLVGKFTPERREHIESIKEHYKQKLEDAKNIESAIFHSSNKLSSNFSYPKLDSLSLSILSDSLCSNVREFVTHHANTPGEILEHLAKDSNYWVLVGVATNPNTPPHVLESLAKDENAEVRYWVANNPNTIPHILELLAKDKDCWVRYWVATNPNTPICLHYYLHYKEYLELL